MGEVLTVLWNSLAGVLEVPGANWTAHSTRYFGMKPTTFDGDFLNSGLLSSYPPRRLGALSDWWFPRLPSHRIQFEGMNGPENERGIKKECIDYNRTRVSGEEVR